MTMRSLRPLLLALLVLAVAAPTAAPQTIKMPGGGKVTVNIPAPKAPKGKKGKKKAKRPKARKSVVTVGIAEQKTDAGLKRTAMIGAPGDQLFMVSEGEEVSGRYRVSAVGADAVELRDLLTGATRRLALR